jgi:hypothetical protein
MTAQSGVRTVSVKPPSVRRETAAVALGLVQIVFWSSVAIAASRPAKRDPAAGLLADEVSFGTLDAAEQRLYRRALEGLAEAEDVRSATGSWPTVEALADRGVAPFAPDPLDRANYQWTMTRDPLVVNYVGIPRSDDRPALVIAAVEPEPGAMEIIEADETHHELADGTMIHVGVWRGTLRTVPAAPIKEFDFMAGWRRIASGGSK